MSDYLDNLAARTLNLAPVVQPRQASLFEPLSIADVNAGHGSSENKSLREALSSTDSDSEVPAAHLLALQADKLRPPMRNEATIREIENANSNESKDRVLDLLYEAIIRRPDVTSRSQRIESAMGHSSMESERHRAGLGWLRSQPHRPLEGQVNSTKTAEGKANDFENSKPRNAKFQDLESHHFATNDHVEVQPNLHRQSQASLIAIASMPHDGLPTSASRKAFAESAATSQAPPTIRVTIGRIDVRAVFSQPTATQVSRDKRSAAMSLNEYLKQRNEGRR